MSLCPAGRLPHDKARDVSVPEDVPSHITELGISLDRFLHDKLKPCAGRNHRLAIPSEADIRRTLAPPPLSSSSAATAAVVRMTTRAVLFFVLRSSNWLRSVSTRSHSSEYSSPRLTSVSSARVISGSWIGHLTRITSRIAASSTKVTKRMLLLSSRWRRTSRTGFAAAHQP